MNEKTFGQFHLWNNSILYSFLPSPVVYFTHPSSLHYLRFLMGVPASRLSQPLLKCTFHVVTWASLQMAHTPRSPTATRLAPLCSAHRTRSAPVPSITSPVLLTKMLPVGCLVKNKFSVCIIYLISIQGNWRTNDLKFSAISTSRKWPLLSSTEESAFGPHLRTSATSGPSSAWELLTCLWSSEVKLN